jgi:hypothetical protein
MKVRGGRRRRDAQVTHAWRSVQTIDWDALGRAMQRIGEAAVAVVAAVERTANAWVRAFKIAAWSTRLNTRNRWVATHQLPARPSPWAAPLMKETP